LVAWLKQRRRLLLGLERRKFLGELRSNGAVDAYLQQFKRELGLVESVLTGPDFRKFVAPYVPIFAPAVHGEA
jgi:hypothetical protein